MVPLLGPWLVGRVFGESVNVHEATGRNADEVVSPIVAQWAFLTKWRDGDVKQAGVESFQVVVADAQFVHLARRRCFDENIRRFDETKQSLAAFGAVNIERHPSLVGVEVEMVEAALDTNLAFEIRYA